jgi:hypothetical protein
VGFREASSASPAGNVIRLLALEAFDHDHLQGFANDSEAPAACAELTGARRQTIRLIFAAQFEAVGRAPRVGDCPRTRAPVARRNRS